MSLRIVRYRNYGKAMQAEPNKNNIITHNFYWCFFELSNGAIIDVHYTENYDDNGVDLGDEYIISYQEDYSFNLLYILQYAKVLGTPIVGAFKLLINAWGELK